MVRDEAMRRNRMSTMGGSDIEDSLSARPSDLGEVSSRHLLGGLGRHRDEAI